MRTVVDGQMWLSYSQAYVTSGGDEHPDLQVSFSGQSNGLCGAALEGCLYLVTGLHTGEVPVRVEIHDHEPPVGDGWEEVVEASFTPLDEPILLMGCIANDGHEFALDVLPYRVRYCAVGMDAARAADTRSDDESELDRYLLQFWPAPPAPDRIARQTSDIAGYWHGVVRDVPSPAELARRKEVAAAEDVQRRAEQEELAAARAREWRDTAVWGGPRPAGPLGDTPAAAAVAKVDLALAEKLVRLAPQRQGHVARWSARVALVEAGLDGIDWIAAATEALDAGAELPAPFDDPAAPVNRLFTDPRVLHTTVTTPDGRTDNLSQQAMALYALITAADPDPVQALFVAVQHAQLAFGRHRLDVLHDLLMTELHER